MKQQKTNIPAFTLDRQNKELMPRLTKAVNDVIDSGQFILGDNVKKLEQEIAGYCGARYAVGVASGSDALYLSLMACDVGPGDEVITTPFTFFATAGAIVRVGARPVFVDIEEDTYNMDMEKLGAAITEKTKAVIPIHLYGCAADMDPLKKILSGKKIRIIEDAAQALGTDYKDCKIGSGSDFSCFSFFPTKNLGSFGDAGMVTTDNAELAEKLRVLRVHGSKPKYYHDVLGCNSRLDEMQAAILRVKLPHLESWVERRRTKAAIYNHVLCAVKEVQQPREPRYTYHSYHQYTIRVKKRDQLQKYLQENGIGTAIYYPLCLHQQKVFKNLGYETGDFPVSEKAAQEVLSLPMFPELTDDEAAYISDIIKNFVNS